MLLYPFSHSSQHPTPFTGSERITLWLTQEEERDYLNRESPSQKRSSPLHSNLTIRPGAKSEVSSFQRKQGLQREERGIVGQRLSCEGNDGDYSVTSQELSELSHIALPGMCTIYFTQGLPNPTWEQGSMC